MRQGLLDIDIEVTHGVDDAHCRVLAPAGVGVRAQYVAGRQLGRDLPDPLDVHGRVFADLHLELREAEGVVFVHLVRHLVRIGAADDLEELHAVLHPAAQQQVDGLVHGLAEDVPAGHVDRRLHVRVLLEEPIHAVVELVQLERAFPR